MPRKPVPYTHEFPYHVVARANNREWFHVSLAECWDIFCTQLAAVSKSYDARILAFVLMSNHYHLMIQTPRANLGKITNYFMREVAKEILRRSGRENHIFGGRNRPTLLLNEGHIYNVYKYVYRNPVDAGICALAEEYPYSTLHSLIRNQSFPFKFHDDLVVNYGLIPQNLSQRLQWINEEYPGDVRLRIQKGLSRRVFPLDY